LSQIKSLLRQTLPAAGLVLLSTAALGVAELHPVTQSRSPVGIIAAGDAAATVRLVAAADGRLISAGGWLGVVYATSDDPEFAAKLYQAGAVLVFRADSAVGCADPKTPARTS
jgi:hypothetical protein